MGALCTGKSCPMHGGPLPFARVFGCQLSCGPTVLKFAGTPPVISRCTASVTVSDVHRDHRALRNTFQRILCIILVRYVHNVRHCTDHRTERCMERCTARYTCTMYGVFMLLCTTLVNYVCQCST